MTNLKIQVIVALLKMLDSNYYKKALVPTGTTQILDVPYAADASHWHKMDIIKPVKEETEACRNGKLPVMINIHGGGWVYGDKDSYYRYYCMNLAKCGFAVISMNYRLATKTAYPGQIEDVFELLEFLGKYGDEYGLDTNQVFLVGDSAGANIAGIVGVILKNEAVRKAYLSCESIAKYFCMEHQPVIRALGLCCGVYNFDTLLGEDIEFACRQEILECVFGRKDFRNHPLYEYMDVPGYLTPDYFPVFVMGSKSDNLYPETEKFIRAVEKLGIPLKKQIWAREENLPHVFHLKESSPHQEEVRLEMTSFFQEQMKDIKY